MERKRYGSGVSVRSLFLNFEGVVIVIENDLEKQILNFGFYIDSLNNSIDEFSFLENVLENFFGSLVNLFGLYCFENFKDSFGELSNVGGNGEGIFKDVYVYFNEVYDSCSESNGDFNRVMFFRFGGSEIFFISLDKKYIILEKKFKDIVLVLQVNI